MPYQPLTTYLTQKAGMRLEEVEHVMPLVTAGNYKKGDLLLREGEVCDASIFVEKGLLRTYTLDEAGKEHIVQFAPENWFTGDRGSIYFSDPAYFFIEAVEDSEVVFVPDAAIDKASDLSAAFRQYNKTLLHNHIRNLQKRINLLLGATAEQRYLSFITQYPDLLLRVPQWMIASYLGITPESLSRVRKELADKNFKPS
ncbi:Crp/Fnr family transcriptional regulator [Constantimarinum furrinae]|nr:Crp/Fnr family transcriptional regulator [Constantimarinum furrinae]